MRGVLVCLLLAGCAGSPNHVVPTGKGTYMLSTHGVMGWSSGPAQKAKALEEANTYCNDRHQEMEQINSSASAESGFGKIASAEVEFKCVSR